jgi:hypothetical protein
MITGDNEAFQQLTSSVEFLPLAILLQYKRAHKQQHAMVDISKYLLMMLAIIRRVMLVHVRPPA